MFEKFFSKYPDFKLIDSETNFVGQYKDKLPLQLVQFIEKFGTGTYMNGFLKIINPNEYQNILDAAYHNEDKEIVFGITAFGDFILWTGDSVRLVKFRYGTYSIIENDDDMEWFFNMDLTEDGYLKDNFNCNTKDLKLIKEKLGELDYDECYGYVPLLALGGHEKIENLQKVKIKEHIHLITELTGKVN